MKVSNTLPLATLDESGRPPKSRIASPSDAHTISESVIYAGQERSRFYARLRGAFDGQPPYNPQRLRAEAQSWRANVNFMEMKASSSAALVPFYDLFSGARYYANVQTREGTVEEQVKWSNILTEEFDWLLKHYDGFDFNMQQMMTDMVRYGRGFLTFQDKTDWRFRCVPQHKCYVPDGTQVWTGDIELLVIRQEFYVHELWNYIENKEVASQTGWDTRGVTRAIINAIPQTEAENVNVYDYVWLQQRIKDRDLYEGLSSPTVMCRHILCREFDGSVSHYIIEEYTANYGKSEGTVDDNPLEKGYLFQSVGRFKNFNQFIVAFFLETADGSWNGAQGLGHDIFSLMALKDRIKCTAVDSMFLRSGINLQAKTANAANKAQLVRLGPVNIIPPDFEVQQATVIGDIDGPIVVDDLLNRVVENNTGIYRPRQDRPTGNPRTAKEVELTYQQGAILANSVVNRFYGNLDKLYPECYRRAANLNIPENDSSPQARLARQFLSNCRNRGVPDKAIVNVDVRAYRNAGNGSPIMRQQAIMQTMQLFPLLPEGGKEKFVNYALSSINGQAMADLFYPPDPEQTITEHHRTAMLENAALKIGAPITITPNDNHVIHAQVHLQAASQAASALQQGAQPEDVAAFIENAGPHIGQHINAIKKNPTRKIEAKALEAQLKQLGRLHDNLKGHIADTNQQRQDQQQKMLQAQQQVRAINNGGDPQTQIKRAQAASDIQMKQAKTQQVMRLKAQKQQQDMVLKDARTASDIRRKRMAAFSE